MDPMTVPTPATSVAEDPRRRGRGTILGLARSTSRLALIGLMGWGAWLTYDSHTSWLRTPCDDAEVRSSVESALSALPELADWEVLLRGGEWSFDGVPCRLAIRRVAPGRVVEELERLPESPPAGVPSKLEREGLALLRSGCPRVKRVGPARFYRFEGDRWGAVLVTTELGGLERFQTARVASFDAGGACSVLEFSASGGDGPATAGPDLMPVPGSWTRLALRRGDEGRLDCQVFSTGASGLAPVAWWHSMGWELVDRLEAVEAGAPGGPHCVYSRGGERVLAWTSPGGPGSNLVALFRVPKVAARSRPSTKLSRAVR
jgi:hypothetical protein